MENKPVPIIYTTKTDMTISQKSRQLLLEDYEIVSVTASGPNSYKYQILDPSALEKLVLSSIRVEHGRNEYRYYFLLKKDSYGGESQKAVEKAVCARQKKQEGKEEAEEITGVVRMTDCMEIPDQALRNLLLKAMKNIGRNEPEYSDIGGGPYLYSGKGLEKGEIVTLNYWFDEEGVLHQDLVTFTSLAVFPRNENGEYQDQTLKTKAVYCHKPEVKTVQREYSPKEGEELYVLEKKDTRKRNTLTYFSFPGLAFTAEGDLTQKWEKFEQTRIMQLIKLRDRFNELYGKYGITISFNGYEQVGEEKTNRPAIRKNREPIRKALNGQTVNVVNTDPLHEKDAETMEEALEEAREAGFGEYSEISVQRSKRPDPDCLNIILIHDKDYYKNNKMQDPHGDYLQCQHVTYENWDEKKRSRSSIARVCILEAREKKDISNRHVSLADCSLIPETMYFVKDFSYSSNRQRIHRYVAMKMEPEGTMEFAIQTPRRSDLNFEECFPGFDSRWFDCERVSDNADFAVKMSDSVNLVRNTGIRTIIDPEEAKRALDPLYNKGKGVNRKKGTKEYELAGLVGIRAFHMEGKNCYICGMKDDGLEQEIARAPLIRECLPVGESRDLTENLLPLLCVDFVRLNQLTVNPFPIKYMREFLKMSGETIDGE